MRALITGAGGQVGRALLARAPEGWACTALKREDLDLTDHSGVRDAVARYAPDLILNAAAFTAVDRAESEEQSAFAINAEAVGVLSEAAESGDAHLVHLSTSFVFDGTADRAYRPGDALSPLSAYGRSKAAGENNAGPRATIVRTSWVYRARGKNFVTTMLGLMRTRHEVGVVADQVGAPTWATWLGEVVWALGGDRRGGIWHYSDGGEATWYDFAVAIQEEALALNLLDREIPLVPIATAEYPAAARRPAFSRLDSSATHAALGTSPVHWRENLRQMLAEMA